MSRVYLQAAVLALVGVGLAVADRAMRPVATVEKNPGETTPAAGQGGTGPAPVPGKGDQPPKSPDKTPDKPTAEPPKGVPQPAPEKPPVGVKPAPPVPVDPSTLTEKVQLAQAFALFEAGASFVDGRKPDEYAAGHVRDAINLRNEDVQQNNQAWQDFFQAANLTGTVYVVYCYGKDCHEAEQLRETLTAVGFKKVFVMEASFEEWKAAGHPAQ